MRGLLCPALLGLLLGTGASKLVVLEQVQTLPERWAFSGAAKDDDTLALKVALTQPRLGDLKTRLLEISTPGRPEYGHHLSGPELSVYQEHSRASEDSVSRWLESNGIVDIRTEGHWVSFNATVRQTKTLLDTDLGYYAYNGGAPVLRAPTYAVPAELQDHISFVFPLSNFMAPPASRLREESIDRQFSALSSTAADEYLQCSRGVQPECLRKLYGINYTAPDAGPSPSRLGIAGFLEEHVSMGDLASFMKSYAWDVPSDYSFAVESVSNGTNDEGNPGVEAMLDVEYGVALGYPARVTYYITSGRAEKIDPDGNKVVPGSELDDNEPYHALLEHLLAKPDGEIPHVLSVSYADDEQSVPRPYAERVCGLFALLAARGVSVLAATGDGGSRGTGQVQRGCYTNDGAAAPRRRAALPTFPASCPYVTAVGATSNEGPPVSAAQYSAGGFSRYFAMPAWQAAAAGPYARAAAEMGGPTPDMFDAGGRATPDISAVGSQFVIRRAGADVGVQGTSASTPVLAAMVALVNDARLRAGKNSTGWLNPALYSDRMRDAIVDVTEGRSRGCWFPEGSVAGWAATAGWDAATGLGTPNTFEKLLAILG
ncbi:hypothetical protein GGTG_03244 [Gaeumannomyces tritici R3-111a-1]|uniref:tripeptidyl-peptidase II n=1 Tax=Gaeumannomyces tritici (strain R3-111a-1) TaxID=644352 RepID=J3NPN7_GAET3|nr:hypothetical protein GGTG_03244 [Gaeumannomyces tritici R3-111a-1]EJT78142.1 hypothetical protein GGTG_03244 [Gaeumannomyces tritici R3-111a-1]